MEEGMSMLKELDKLIKEKMELMNKTGEMEEEGLYPGDKGLQSSEFYSGYLEGLLHAKSIIKEMII
jgi:hypothetical protein